MARPEDLRELLFADVALVDGHATARHVAAALLKYWERRDRSDTTLQEELASVAGIGASDLAAIEATVAELVANTGADAAAAITRRGGIAHELHAAVSRQDGEVSRQLTALGTGIRVQLRPLRKDRYLDFMPVGEGGMGIVYWAIDTELGRQVAFKVVRPPMDGPGAGITPPAPVRMRAPDGSSATASAFEELKARFIQEAWVTGGMEHPGIVPIYEVGETEGGVPYYTMRFIRGRRTLEDALRENQGQPLETRLTLVEPFMRVCDAVAYAHDRGVVHRDIKPANVALGEYGETIVIDWGLAKLSAQSDAHASRWRDNITRFRDDTSMATMTSALGTPGYMAPEAALGEVADVDEVADVYSLGAILFEILTGKKHITFTTFREYAEQVVAAEAPSARALDTDVPEALAALCTSALARDRQVRPRDAGQLAKAVRAWQSTRASEREVELRLAEATRALTEGDSIKDSAVKRKAAERIALAVDRALTLRPGHAEASALKTRGEALQDDARALEDAQARRALLRRVAVPVLVLVAVIGAVVASVIEGQRRNAESARAEASRQRDRAAEDHRRAEEAMGFMTEDLHARLKPEGRLDVLAQIGEQARVHFAGLPAARTEAATFARHMNALAQLTEVYLAQGEAQRARACGEEALAASQSESLEGLPAGLVAFERLRARIMLARVDDAQGFAGRQQANIEAVLAGLELARPPQVAEPLHLATRIHARISLARSLGSTGAWLKAMEAVRPALAEGEQLLTLTGARMRDRILLGEAHYTHAVYATQGLPPGHDAADNAVATALRLRNLQPEDRMVEELHARTLIVKSRARSFEGAWGKAVDNARLAVNLVRKLTELRPKNAAWRGTLALGLARLGDAQAGPKMEYVLGVEAYRESYTLLRELTAVDESSARWMSTLANVCDRLARPRGAAHVLRYRTEAANLARARAALDPENARWQYLVSYTLGVLAMEFPKAPESQQWLEEAYDVAGGILATFAKAGDVYQHHQSVAFELVQRAPDLGRRLEAYRTLLDRHFTLAKAQPEEPSFFSRTRHTMASISGDVLRLLGEGRPSVRPEVIREWIDEVCTYGDAWVARASTADADKARWATDRAGLMASFKELGGFVKPEEAR